MGLSITLLNTKSINLQPSQDHNTHCLWESLVALPINTIWAIKNSYIAESDNGSYIATAIANNKDVAVSGGSQKTQMGTSAFTIEGPTKDKQIIGVNIAPDNIEDGDSQRCELSGIYAIVIMVNTVCEIHLITFGSITVGCNNISALQVFNDDYVFAPIQKDFDLLTAVQNKIHDSPISWIGHHIHGHQDNLNQSLDRWATMNVKMDSTAKAYWNYLKESGYCGPVQFAIGGEQWYLWNGDKKLQQANNATLYNIIRAPRTTNWWVSNQPFGELYPPYQLGCLCRCNAGPKHLPTTFHYKTFLRQWTHQYCSLRVEKQNTKLCPRRNQIKSPKHIWICRGKDTNHIWDNSLHRIRTWLLKMTLIHKLQQLYSNDSKAGVMNKLLRTVPSWPL
jgi:hypothetical protein